MSEIRTASDIYEALKTLHRQLEQLQASGRIVMSRDRLNQDWPDSGPALETALDGLDQAIGATMWMETLAEPTTAIRSWKPRSTHRETERRWSGHDWTMGQPDLYVIAGIDLRGFVAAWVSDLESGGGHSRGLLEHARADPHLGERYGYGAYYLFANIGPRASEPAATAEELLLFAVMAVYQDAGFPGADRTVWDGEAAHVRRAFTYLAEIGQMEAARRLRADVIRRSVRARPPAFEEMLGRSMQHDPARTAAHDQDMAAIDSRSFRAAELLDPDADFDQELAGFLS